MIRKNYSLAAELRKEETKKQSKIQNRQKYQHSLEKLKDADPIKLYNRIERLKNTPDKKPHDLKLLKTLESDWKFILKHGLHKEKVDNFLQKIEKDQKQKEFLSKKLWGLKSVYFNPELNPLGKVPDPKNLPMEILSSLENYTLPIPPSKTTVYEADPRIEQLNIKPPSGEPPKFYKKVYNTGRDHVTTLESETKRSKP